MIRSCYFFAYTEYIEAEGVITMHSKKNGKSGRLLSGVIGAVFGFVLVLSLTAVLTGFLIKEQIGEGIGDWAVYGVHMMAVFVASEMAKKLYGNSEVSIAGIASGIYIAVVVISGLLTEGSFQNIGLQILVICIGFLSSCALCIRKSGRTGKIKKRVW